MALLALLVAMRFGNGNADQCKDGGGGTSVPSSSRFTKSTSTPIMLTGRCDQIMSQNDVISALNFTASSSRVSTPQPQTQQRLLGRRPTAWYEQQGQAPAVDQSKIPSAAAFAAAAAGATYPKQTLYLLGDSVSRYLAARIACQYSGAVVGSGQEVKDLCAKDTGEGRGDVTSGCFFEGLPSPQRPQKKCPRKTCCAELAWSEVLSSA